MTPRLCDTNAAATLVQRSPATLHVWAHRGLLTRYGKDPRGRTLYDLNEVQAIDDLHRQEKAS